jgi:hypothetical protein
MTRSLFAALTFAAMAAPSAAQAPPPTEPPPVNPARAQQAPARPAQAAAAAAKPTLLGDGTYVGEVRAFAGELCPDGWLRADGAEYPAGPPYSALNGVISDLWGSNQASHFRVPDLRGVSLRGWNRDRSDKYADPDVATRELMPGAPGYPSGDKNHVGTYQMDQFQTHRHNDAGHAHAIAGIGYVNAFGCGPHCGALTGGGGVATTSSNANVTEPASLSADELRFGRESRAKNAYILYCIRNGRQ